MPNRANRRPARATPGWTLARKHGGFGGKATQSPAPPEIPARAPDAVCDLCTDMCLEEDADPACVYACPHDAAHRVDGKTLFDQYLTGLRTE